MATGWRFRRACLGTAEPAAAMNARATESALDRTNRPPCATDFLARSPGCNRRRARRAGRVRRSPPRTGSPQPMRSWWRRPLNSGCRNCRRTLTSKQRARRQTIAGQTERMAVEQAVPPHPDEHRRDGIDKSVLADCRAASLSQQGAPSLCRQATLPALRPQALRPASPALHAAAGAWAARPATNSPSRSAASIIGRCIASATSGLVEGRPASIRSQVARKLWSSTRIELRADSACAASDPQSAAIQIGVPTSGDAVAARRRPDERPPCSPRSSGQRASCFTPPPAPPLPISPSMGTGKPGPFAANAFAPGCGAAITRRPATRRAAASAHRRRSICLRRGRSSMLPSGRSMSASPSTTAASISILPTTPGVRSRSDPTDGR